MIANKLELDIIRLYDSNFVNLFSINQISRLLNKKYPYINKKVKGMIKEGILKKTIVGKSHLCSLNLKSRKAVLLMALNEISKLEKGIKNKKEARAGRKAINEIADKISEFVNKNILMVNIFSVVVSDRRIVFIVDDKKKRRLIFSEFENAEVVEKDEFLDMLVYDESIIKNHIVVYGVENFFELVSIASDELKREYSPIKY